MDDGLRPGLRWLGVAAGMVVVVVIAVPMLINALTSIVVFDEEGTDTPLDELDDLDEPDVDLADREPVGSGTAAPVADFGVRAETVRDATATALTIGGTEGDAIVFAFDLIDGDVECVDVVQVRTMSLGSTASELTISAAALGDVTALDNGDSVPAELAVEDSPSSTTSVDDSTEIARFDVTEIYRQWAGGELTDDPEPFVVVVEPVETSPDLHVQFGSSSARGEDAPRLSWAGNPACGEPEDQT